MVPNKKTAPLNDKNSKNELNAFSTFLSPLTPGRGNIIYLYIYYTIVNAAVNRSYKIHRFSGLKYP